MYFYICRTWFPLTGALRHRLPFECGCKILLTFMCWLPEDRTLLVLAAFPVCSRQKTGGVSPGCEYCNNPSVILHTPSWMKHHIIFSQCGQIGVTEHRDQVWTSCTVQLHCHSYITKLQNKTFFFVLLCDMELCKYDLRCMVKRPWDSWIKQTFMQRLTSNVILFGYESICGETADEMTISWEEAGGLQERRGSDREEPPWLKALCLCSTYKYCLHPVEGTNALPVVSENICPLLDFSSHHFGSNSVVSIGALLLFILCNAVYTSMLKWRP